MAAASFREYGYTGPRPPTPLPRIPNAGDHLRISNNAIFRVRPEHVEVIRDYWRLTDWSLVGVAEDGGYVWNWNGDRMIPRVFAELKIESERRDAVGVPLTYRIDPAAPPDAIYMITGGNERISPAYNYPQRFDVTLPVKEGTVCNREPASDISEIRIEASVTFDVIFQVTQENAPNDSRDVRERNAIREELARIRKEVNRLIVSYVQKDGTTLEGISVRVSPSPDQEAAGEATDLDVGLQY